MQVSLISSAKVCIYLYNIFVLLTVKDCERWHMHRYITINIKQSKGEEDKWLEYTINLKVSFFSLK